MADFGYKVSLPGIDVHSATPEQCSVHSSYPPLKAKANQTVPHWGTYSVQFTATITQNTTITLFTVPHNYGYIPLTIANISFLQTSSSTPIVGLGFAGVGATLAINAYSDSSNFYITIYDNFNWTSTSASMQVSYYVFAESGT